MWKKFFVLMFALLGVLSVGYSYYNIELTANNIKNYSSGGSAYGRIGPLEDYDSFYLSAGYGDVEHISWIVLDFVYKDKFGANMAISNDVLGPLPYSKISSGGDELLLTSNYKTISDTVSNNLSKQDKKLVVEHDLSISKTIPTNNVGNNISALKVNEFRNADNNVMPYAFAHFPYEATSMWTYDVYPRNFVPGANMKVIYSNANNWGGTDYDEKLSGYDLDNCSTKKTGCDVNTYTRGYGIISIYEDIYYTPGILYDESLPVFAVSPLHESNEDTTKSSYEILSPDYSFVKVDVMDYAKSTGTPLKLRIKDDTRNITFDSITSKNDPTQKAISKTSKDNTLYMNYSNATIGGNSTVSLLVTQTINGTEEFLYYKPLESALSENQVEFTASDLPNGKYTFYLVNEEFDDSSYEPANCSALSVGHTIEITGSITETYAPVYSAPNTSFWQYNTNVTSGKHVGTFTLSGHNGTANHKLIPSSNISHKEDYNKFLIDSTGKVTVGTDELQTGVYEYRAQSVDETYAPGFTTNMSAEPTSHPEYTYGIISDLVTVVVYPNVDQILYTQSKNESGNYYSLEEINSNNYDLATIKFSDDANIKALKQEGYIIKAVSLVTKGTTTPLSMLEAQFDVSDSTGSTCLVKKKGTIEKGDKEFDILITFQDQTGNKTAELRKSNMKLSIPPLLTYVDQKTNAFLTSDTYSVTYDAVTSSNNSYILWATDQTNPSNKNTKVEYCVLLQDGSACNEDSSTNADIISLIASNGQIQIQAQPPGTSPKQIGIRAMIKQADGSILTKRDLNIVINPVVQKLEWKGTNIQSTGNDIVKADDSEAVDHHPTWKIQLKYDSEVPENNVFHFAALYKGESIEQGKLGLSSNVNGSNGTPPLHISYKTEVTPADQGKISVDEENGTITLLGDLSNDVRITATAQGTGNYTPTINQDDPSTTEINEDGSATLLIRVSTKPSLIFTANSSFVDFKASITSAFAKGTSAFGQLSLNPTGETITEYKIKQVDMYDEASSKWNTVANTTFQIKGNSAIPNQLYSGGTLGQGQYRISLVGMNQLDEVSTVKTITITIEKESFALSKLKWQKKLSDETALSDVTGTIKESDYTNSKKLNVAFVDQGTFQIAVSEKEANILKDAIITYDVKDASSQDIISVSTTGNVTMKKSGTAYVKAHIEKEGFLALDVYLIVEIGQGKVDFVFTDQDGDPLTIDGEALQVSDTGLYEPYSVVYEKDKGLPIFTSNAPAGADVTIQIISESSPTAAHPEYNDVLAFREDDAYVANNINTDTKTCIIPDEDYDAIHLEVCQTMIQNALYSKNDVIKLVATTSATADYQSSTITLPIKVNKADQSDFAFKQNTFSVLPDKNGTFQPTFIHKESTGKIQLSTIADGGTADLPADQAGVKAGTDESFVNKKDTVWYNVVLKEGDEPVQFRVYAKDLGDRNYNPSNEVYMTITVDSQAGSKYDITLESTRMDHTTSSIVTYGDQYFILEAYSIKDDTELNYTYTYEVMDESQAYIQQVSGEANKFKPLKAKERVSIKITRRNDDTGVVEPSMIYTFNIYKKTIDLVVQDIQKLQGQSVSTSEYSFVSEPEFIVEDQALIGNATFSCKRGTKDISTLPYVELSDDQLSITARFHESATNKDVLSNYDITVQNGKLLVDAETSEDSWYELTGGMLDEIISEEGIDGWYRGPVDVNIISTESSVYDQIGKALNDAFYEDKFTVATEGINKIPVYFKNSSTQAISTPQYATIKIDTTAPRITSITGVEVNRDGLKALINQVTGGLFFKPGVEVEILAKEQYAANDESIDVSGIYEIKYDVYHIDDDGNLTKDTNFSGSKQVSERLTITLPESGHYYVEAIAMDRAGNKSDLYGSYINVKKVDIDVDGDHKPDFNDPDGDGCADFNIVYTDEKDGKQKVLNVDANRDGIPEMNIDSDGDGRPDINVDTDGDGKPDLNLLIMTKKLSQGTPSVWKPTQCVSQHGEEYASGVDLTPVINVDLDFKDVIDISKAIPDINIDTDGDMVANINIDTTGDAKPNVNINTLETWVPNKDYTIQGFSYDTMSELKPYLNIDSDGDGRPDINVDVNGDGTADLNIDTDNDGIPNIDIDSTGDGEPDINVDTTGDGTPDKNIVTITEWIPKKDCESEGFKCETTK